MPDGQPQDSTTSEDSGIKEGFKIIKEMFERHEKLRQKDERCRFADFLRTKVTVVRASLPPKTDLNRYFEIMKDETRHVIHVEERRVSEAMREQFREDMWEYHPELLETELLAVRQESIAQPADATP